MPISFKQQKLWKVCQIYTRNYNAVTRDCKNVIYLTEKKSVHLYMNVLITGSGGFVGSHLVDEYLRRGYTVSVIVRKETTFRWIDSNKVIVYKGRYDDASFLEKAVKSQDIIIHSAGVLASTSYEGFYKGNVDVTKNLLKAISIANPNIKRFVHISSLAVALPSPSLENPTNEETINQEPLTKYGKSKLEAEKVVHSFMEKIPITIVRPPAIYGPRDEAIFDYFRLIAKGFIAPIMGFDSKKMSLIHIHDLVRGIYEACQTERTLSQTYYLTSKEFYTWMDIINATKIAVKKQFILPIPLPHFAILLNGYLSTFIGRLKKKPPVFDIEKAKNFTQRHWICSHKKALNDFHFEQKISLQEGIQQTMDWYKNNGWL